MTSERDSDAASESLPEHLHGLVEEVRDAIPIEDVPPAVLDGARAAWTWRLVDEELAELADQEVAVLRAGAGSVATFTADDVFIDLERVATAGATVVVGQVTAPTDVASVEVELAGTPGAKVAAELASGGGFRVMLPGGGPARLVVHLAGGRRIVSSWLG